MLGGAGERLGRGGLLAGELADGGGDELIGARQLAVPGHGALGVVSAQGLRAAQLAKRVELLGHVLHLVDDGGAGLGALAFAGRRHEGGERAHVAALLLLLADRDSDSGADRSEHQDRGHGEGDRAQRQPTGGARATADHVDADGGLPEPQHIAVEKLGLLDALAVQVDAVGAADIADLDVAVGPRDLRVPPRHGGVGDGEIAMVGSSDEEAVLAHREGLHRARRLLDDEVRADPLEKRGIDHLGLRARGIDGHRPLLPG